MSSSKLNTPEFLKASYHIPVIDVRSPSEYAAGHIPAAINIPLFSDTEREIVGTAYKKEGRENAILQGLGLVGPQMAGKLRDAVAAAKEGRLLVHCWRGGMRSESMAWLFSLAGIHSQVLEGGYKAYRNHILDILATKRKTIILGGFTGSSKTHILRVIGKLGSQVIDLEEVAKHKGSAFGSLGQPPQPSTEHFANLLYDHWEKLDPGLPVWLEDESRNIGTVFMPEGFYRNMQESPAIILIMDINTRMPRLLQEYSAYPPEALKSSIGRISKRLGGDNTRDALHAVDEGDFSKAIEITLRYYDKAYRFGIDRKKNDNIIYISTDTDDIETNTSLVLEAAKKIKW